MRVAIRKQNTSVAMRFEVPVPIPNTMVKTNTADDGKFGDDHRKVGGCGFFAFWGYQLGERLPCKQEVAVRISAFSGRQ